MEEVNKYHGGKIYTIRSPSTDKYYIGSTIEKYLSSRLNGHNSCYKKFLNGMYGKMTSFELIKLGDAYIELLELFPCNNKLELHKREGELIREHSNNCVNKFVAGRTLKQYYTDNKEKLIEKAKQYSDVNKVKIIETKKQYYEKNKDKITKNNKQTYICECGTTSTIAHKSRHNKTIKHQDYLKSIQ